MKKIFLFFLLLFISSLSIYSLPPNTQAVVVDVKFDSEGNPTFFSNNKDYCNYYLFVTFSDVIGYDLSHNPYSTTVWRGERQLCKLRKNSDTSPSFRWSYAAYRGVPSPKLNLDFIYSFPVKSGDSIRASVAKNYSDFTLTFDLSFAGDTIYACREGCICDNKLTDQTFKGNMVNDRIIVYHKDDSFSEYSQFEKSLVYPGEYVKLGQPIAINTGKTLPKIITFAVYYLDKNKVKNPETGNKYSHLVPVFHTLNAGDVKLEEDAVYIGEINDNLLTQEMSAKEKKKYEKDKEKKQNK